VAYQAVDRVLRPCSRVVPLGGVNSVTISWSLDDSLCTAGGDSSIILTVEFLSCSRRQRMNEFNAALEAEYAERLAEGIMARLEPVLSLL